MILPLLDYSDIVWGDKHNKTKLILDKAKHFSATELINELDWLDLSETRRLVWADGLGF